MEKFEESLILMKDQMCWDMEDIKNLKINTRKETEVFIKSLKVSFLEYKKRVHEVRNCQNSDWPHIKNKLELLQSQAPAEGVLRGVECSRIKNKEQGAWRKEHGAKSK